MKLKIIIMLGLFSIFLADVQADTVVKHHVFSVGDDGNFIYRYRLNAAASIGVGYYTSDTKRSNNLGQSYDRSILTRTLSLRYNFYASSELRFFLNFNQLSVRVRYTGDTNSQNYDRQDSVLYLGIEYMLSDKFSVEAMLGYGVSETDNATDLSSSFFGPTTLLAMNYSL